MQKRGILCDNMDNLYDIRYRLKCHERFRLLSDWHQRVCDLAEQKHRQRLAKSSSCLEETLAFHLTHEVNKVTLFEDHVESYFQNKNYTENPKIKQFFRECTIDDVTNMICQTYSNVECRNERVKSQHTKHSALQHVNYCLSILKVIPDITCAMQIKTLKPSLLLNQIDDKREHPNHELRRHFYKEEIDKLFDECKYDAEFTCVLRLLRETGLRVNALVSMRISNVTDFNGTPKAETSVLDKGRKLRTILLSDNMRTDLETYLAQRAKIAPIDRNDYLFIQKTNRNKHMTTMYVRKQLIKLANACGIHGIHIHPHAFRHTLVNNLMSMGNDIHNVSKFLGHSSISTTETYYWTSKITDIIPNMTIPWLNKFKTIDDTEDESDMEQIAVDILIVCVSILSHEQRETLKQKIPNIDAIIGQLYSNVSSIAIEE
jgi:site-specific recombinase XerD